MKDGPISSQKAKSLVSSFWLRKIHQGFLAPIGGIYSRQWLGYSGSYYYLTTY